MPAHDRPGLSNLTIDVAVVGRDGRTSAILQRCAESPLARRILEIPEVPPAGLGDLTGRLGELGWGADSPAVVIVGPEAPLCAGLADRLEAELALPVFGPRRDQARIEASKSWARELVARHGIPGNPEHRVLRRGEEQAVEAVLREYEARLGGYVVKPDGLTGGKGVKVSGEHLGSIEEGIAYARLALEADGVVVVEERLDGEEFSLQTVTDGTTSWHLPLVQDHKRAFEGDTGPNTGGMGSYSMADHSLPFLEQAELEAAREINERVVRALGEELGSPYRGVLYGGFMATGDGVRVVEYNCRLGDPEATNVLSILGCDFVEVAHAAATGQLDQVALGLEPAATVCKYVVPEAYPGTGGGGEEIDATALGPLLEDGSLRCYWSGVSRREGELRATMLGSRALAVVGVAALLEEAEQLAEHAARLVAGPVRHRSDIGTAELLERRLRHMSRLRRR
jgi:phosphoribosylamine--glycine ligase